MEIAILIPFFTLYIIIRYFVEKRETAAGNDIRRFAQGIELFKARKYKEAYAFFDTALQDFPKSALAYTYRGKCSLAEGNIHSAMYNFTQALSYDNTLAECYLEKGKILLGQQQYRDAFREYDKAVWFSHGNNPEILRERGIARMKVKLYRQSSADFSRAVELGDEESCNILMQPPFYGVPLKRINSLKSR